MTNKVIRHQWLRTGDETFAALLAAIDEAKKSIRFECYIYAAGHPGEDVRAALMRAVQRGVKVQVLIDAWGSFFLPGGFWDEFKELGGECRWFNPMHLKRFGFRNHRKLMVFDKKIAFVGGFNVAPEYTGDGITRGWCDLGLKIEGPVVNELIESFDLLYQLADFKHGFFMGLRRPRVDKGKKRTIIGQLLHTGPGRGRSWLQRRIIEDIKHAKAVQIISAYFVPTRKLRAALTRAAKRGARVQIILPAKSDVFVSQLASHCFYRTLMRAGVEIHEYQPQILHGKLIIVDDVVYVGSANLDTRSLHINYELMLRLDDSALVTEAKEIYENRLSRCERVDFAEWKRNRTWWQRLKERWSLFLITRIDPYIAQRQLRTLR